MAIETPIQSRTRGLPLWAVAFTGVVLLVGAGYLAGNFVGENPPIGGPPQVDTTAQAQAIIASMACESCHGPGLTGALAPSLHGVAAGPVSENLQELGASNPDDWAELWIAGTDAALSGLDRGGMPVFGAEPFNLSEDDIAIVVDYLKTLQ